jgi:hypothetical protein
LLHAKSVEARLVALAGVPNEALSDEMLRGLLVDRAPRVRELALIRALRRRWDVAAFYRRQLADDIAPPRVLVASLDGIAVTGDESDIQSVQALLAHPSARVRAAAVGAVEGRATSDRAVEILTHMLLDPSARVSAAASRVLVRLGASPDVAEQAWASSEPGSRRAAWRLTRATGSWNRVEADLQAATDPDQQLSALGHAGVTNWLQLGAATTWDPLAAGQRDRLAALLPQAPLSRHDARLVAFHAGIRVRSEQRDAPDTEEELASSTGEPVRRRWLRLVRRR